MVMLVETSRRQMVPLVLTTCIHPRLPLKTPPRHPIPHHLTNSSRTHQRLLINVQIMLNGLNADNQIKQHKDMIYR